MTIIMMRPFVTDGRLSVKVELAVSTVRYFATGHQRVGWSEYLDLLKKLLDLVVRIFGSA